MKKTIERSILSKTKLQMFYKELWDRRILQRESLDSGGDIWFRLNGDKVYSPEHHLYPKMLNYLSDKLDDEYFTNLQEKMKKLERNIKFLQTL